MTIEIGDNVPEGLLRVMREDGPGSMNASDLFRQKKVVLFSVPGAFTPTCSKEHLPGYIKHAAAFKAKGVDIVACMAVNDVFVMDAWGKDAGAGSDVLMLADGNGTYTASLGLELDARDFGMGDRGQRFAMVVESKVLIRLYVEEPMAFKVSSAEYVLEHL